MSQLLKQLEKKSQVPGPVVWLTAGIHGDEPGGTAVVERLFKELGMVELIKGSLRALPLINKSGAQKKIRELPETGEDLNRLFPGQSNGTLGQKIAHQVWQTIVETKSTLVLDLHNDWINSIPYILLDNDTDASLALASGLITVREDVKTLPIERTLSGSLNKNGIPALTLELGGAYVVDEKNVRIGVNAVSRILCQLGLITQEIYLETKTFDAGVSLTSSAEMIGEKVFNYSDQPRPKTAGRIKMLVTPGQMIKKEDLIAEIEGGEKLFAERDGILLGYTDQILSCPDQEIVACATI